MLRLSLPTSDCGLETVSSNIEGSFNNVCILASRLVGGRSPRGIIISALLPGRPEMAVLCKLREPTGRHGYFVFHFDRGVLPLFHLAAMTDRLDPQPPLQLQSSFSEAEGAPLAASASDVSGPFSTGVRSDRIRE